MAADPNDAELEDYVVSGIRGGTSTYAVGSTGAGIDNTPHFSAFLLDVASGRQNRTLRLRSGYYYFYTQVPVINPYSVQIVGQGMQNTFLMRGYNESLTQRGFLHFESAGCKLANLSAIGAVNTSLNPPQTTGGCGIALVGYSGTQFPSAFVGEDLWVSTDTVTPSDGGAPAQYPCWDISFFVNGQNQSAPNPPGIRDICIRNCKFFAATQEIMYLYNVNNAQIDADFFPAPSTPTASTSNVTVSGDATHYSNNILIKTAFINQLSVSYTNSLTVIHSAGAWFVTGGSGACSGTANLVVGSGVNRLAIFPKSTDYYSGSNC